MGNMELAAGKTPSPRGTRTSSAHTTDSSRTCSTSRESRPPCGMTRVGSLCCRMGNLSMALAKNCSIAQFPLPMDAEMTKMARSALRACSQSCSLLCFRSYTWGSELQFSLHAVFQQSPAAVSLGDKPWHDKYRKEKKTPSSHFARSCTSVAFLYSAPQLRLFC